MEMIFEKYDKTWLGGIAIKKNHFESLESYKYGIYSFDNRQPSDSH